VLHPIANLAHDAWLVDLAVALRALPLGEVRPPLKPSSKGLHPYGRGMSGWQLKLAALAWVKFQVAAKKSKGMERFGTVPTHLDLKRGALAFKNGVRQPKSIWVERSSRKRLKLPEKRQFYRSLSQQIANGQISKFEAKHHFEYFENVWGPERLKQIGQAFRAIPKKRGREKKRGKRASRSPFEMTQFRE
jgi:hypothetical protein